MKDEEVKEVRTPTLTLPLFEGGGKRSYVDRLLLLVAALCLSLLASAAFAGAREIRGFALTVSNLDSAVAFYEQALGFEKVGERIVAETVRFGRSLADRRHRACI